jgi:lysozyme family protein
MATDKVSAGALALRRLARDGAAKQMAFALRDAAVIIGVGVLALFLSKPLGLVVIVAGVVMLGMFAFAVLTSGSRLQKIVRDPARIRAVVLANGTKRSVLARGWIVGVDNRAVTVPFLASDADVVAATFVRTIPAKPLSRFDDEASARAEVKRLSAG